MREGVFTDIGLLDLINTTIQVPIDEAHQSLYASMAIKIPRWIALDLFKDIYKTALHI